jgi:hypothetical protein
MIPGYKVRQYLVGLGWGQRVRLNTPLEGAVTSGFCRPSNHYKIEIVFFP